MIRVQKMNVIGPSRICNHKSGQIRPRPDLKKSNPVQP